MLCLSYINPSSPPLISLKIIYLSILLNEQFHDKVNDYLFFDYYNLNYIFFTYMMRDYLSKKHIKQNNNNLLLFLLQQTTTFTTKKKKTCYLMLLYVQLSDQM